MLGDTSLSTVSQHGPESMLDDKVMTQALRNSGIAASGHGFRSSFKDWARHHTARGAGPYHQLTDTLAGGCVPH